MKILFIHDFYRNFGGEDAAALAEKWLLEEYKERVIFYSRNNKEIANYGFLEKLRFPLEAIDSVRTRTDIGAIIRQERPDVAYVHNAFPLISSSIYRTLYDHGVPCVQFVHDFRFLCPNGLFHTKGAICERCKTGSFFNAVRHRCYRDSYAASFVAASVLAAARRNRVLDLISVFVCPTVFSRQKLIEGDLPAAKIRIKPHFVDTTGVEPRFAPGKYLLYLGRLSPEKGVLGLVHALAGCPEIPLKIAGSGRLEPEIRTFLRERQIRHIELVGFKGGAEKWDILRNSACVVLPSECYETFGLAVLEAYAAGKPVIASRLGALPFVIEDGKSGLLFEAGDRCDLCAKIRYLLARPAELERMGRYGRALVDTKYRPAESYRELKQIFSAALAPRNARRKIA
ncbi:MAG TPA: glycosyltransferase family 4 protein [Candidatus Acidoferrum sp.]|nr:glycosyltransferase family 4 protein [Candidatus Acidoferrum sp.]